MFNVFIDYGYESELLVGEYETLEEAQEVADGEHCEVEVITFADNGEAVVVYRSECDYEDDGQPSWEQEWADFGESYE